MHNPINFTVSRVGSLVFFATLLLGAPSRAQNPANFPEFAKGDYSPAALGPREPELRIDYPGSALARGITNGRAVVSVLVGADGKVMDSLAIGYTDKAFAKALVDHVQSLDYRAATFKGQTVPGRFDIGYQFEKANAELNSMDAGRSMTEQIQGSKLSYSSVSEKKLDRPLEFTNAALPRIPLNFKADSDAPVKVFVTFYVDEEGHVRVPNVDSASSPALIAGALKAVRTWTFKPGTVAGKPVLVYAGRSVGFVPREVTP
jgi:hypothetical protein